LFRLFCVGLVFCGRGWGVSVAFSVAGFAAAPRPVTKSRRAPRDWR